MNQYRKKTLKKAIIIAGLGTSLLASTLSTITITNTSVFAATGNHDGQRLTWGAWWDNEGFYNVDGQAAYCIIFGAPSPSGEEMIQKQIEFESNAGTLALLNHGFPTNLSGLMEKHGITAFEAQETMQWAFWAHANAQGLPQRLEFTWSNFKIGANQKREAVKNYALELMNLTQSGNVPMRQISVERTETKATFNPATRRLETGAYRALVDSSSPITFSNLPSDIFVIDMDGNRVAQVAAGQNFKLATNDLSKSGAVSNIDVNANVKLTAAIIYQSTIPGNQDLIVGHSVDPLRTVTVSASFEPALGDIQFKKLDQTTQQGLGGMQFNLLDSTGKVIQTATSAADGTVVFSQLLVGEYSVQEITPTGDGYVNDTTKYPVTIKPGQTTDLNGISNVFNKQTESNISKTDATSGAYVDGAKLQVLQNGQIVTEWVSTKDGVHKINKLPAGEYTLREIMPPGRYMFSQDVPFTVKEDGTITKVNMVDERTEVVIEKRHTTSGNLLQGATFELLDSNGKQATMLDSKGNVIPAIATTDKDGQAHFSGVVAGTYTAREIKAPDGYELNKETIEVTVSNKNATASKFFDLAYGKVKFAKMDKDTNKPLAGMEFVIKDDKGKIVKKAKSNQQGIVEFEDIVEGKYTVTEIPVLGDGYVDDTTVYPVTVKPLETVALNSVSTVFNKKNEVRLSKLDNENNKAVEGAIVTLTNKDGKVVFKGDGNSIIKGIPAGKYKLKELMAPTRFLMTEQETDVTITEDGKVSVGVIHDETRDITITKRDGNDGRKLEGAEFELQTLDGKVVEMLDKDNKLVPATGKTDATGKVRFRGIPIGDYKIVEKTPPAGYTINSDLSVKAAEKTDTQYDFVDYKIPEVPKVYEELPKTGGEVAGIGIESALAGGSGIGAGLIALIRRFKK